MSITEDLYAFYQAVKSADGLDTFEDAVLNALEQLERRVPFSPALGQCDGCEDEELCGDHPFAEGCSMAGGEWGFPVTTDGKHKSGL